MPAPNWTAPAYPPGATAPTGTSPPVGLTSAGTGSGFVTGSTIDIAQGTTVTSTTPLTLVADGNVTVAGSLQAPSIVLVSLNGDVIVQAGARVGIDSVPATAPGTAQALDATITGNQNRAGGVLTILALKGAIRIEGAITGGNGGEGQTVIAESMLASGAIQIGSASATGGDGGAGGDVALAALDSIGVSGSIFGGTGGDGGDGVARGPCAFSADGRGGLANTGGSIYFHGFGKVQIFLPGVVQAGDGGHGGRGDASGADGASGHRSGGDATARGNLGGQGGTVAFDSTCIVMGAGNPQAGMGGDGGSATSRSGDGASGSGLHWSGSPGGDADSRAGDGGPPGATPQQPVPGGGVQPGRAAQPDRSATGSGGPAVATAGAGGSAVNSTFGSNALSGTATANGGKSGNPGGGVGQSKTTAPVASGTAKATATGGH